MRTDRDSTRSERWRLAYFLTSPRCSWRTLSCDSSSSAFCTAREMREKKQQRDKWRAQLDKVLAAKKCYT